MKPWRDKTLDELDAEYRAAVEAYRASPAFAEDQERERRQRAAEERAAKRRRETFDGPVVWGAA